MPQRVVQNTIFLIQSAEIHKASPGEGRANFRSATPMGFAKAVFESNAEGAVA